MSPVPEPPAGADPGTVSSMELPQAIGVTGAAGFIGSHLCERLLAEGARSSASTTSRTARSSNLATCLRRPGFRFEEIDCRDAPRACARSSTGCDAIVHLARRRSRATAARSRRSRPTSPARAPSTTRRSRSTRTSSIASTSDVYGNARRRSREDAERDLGPPTTRRWAYATSKLYDEHLGARAGRGARPAGHDPAPLRLLRPAQPPELVGRPAGGVHRAPARRRADGDPRRRPAGAHVHVRRRHGRRRSCARWTRRTPQGEILNVGGDEPTPILELADAVQRRAGHAGRRCGRRSSPTRPSAAATRTSAAASPTPRRRDGCSGSARRSGWRRACRPPSRGIGDGGTQRAASRSGGRSSTPPGRPRRAARDDPLRHPGLRRGRQRSPADGRPRPVRPSPRRRGHPRRRRLDRRHRGDRRGARRRTCGSPSSATSETGAWARRSTRGLRAALAASADEDAIVTLEADGTSDLADLPGMLALLADGRDVVLGLGPRPRWGPGRGGSWRQWARRALSRHLPDAWAARARSTPVLRLPRLPSPGAAPRGRGLRAGSCRSSGFAASVELLLKLHRTGATIAEVPTVNDWRLGRGTRKAPLLPTALAYSPADGHAARRTQLARAAASASSAAASSAPRWRFAWPRRAPRVTVLEREPALGGLAGTMDFDGHRVDRFYHAITPADERMLALAGELGLGARCASPRWERASSWTARSTTSTAWPTSPASGRLPRSTGAAGLVRAWCQLRASYAGPRRLPAGARGSRATAAPGDRTDLEARCSTRDSTAATTSCRPPTCGRAPGGCPAARTGARRARRWAIWSAATSG